MGDVTETRACRVLVLTEGRKQTDHPAAIRMHGRNENAAMHPKSKPSNKNDEFKQATGSKERLNAPFPVTNMSLKFSGRGELDWLPEVEVSNGSGNCSTLLLRAWQVRRNSTQTGAHMRSSSNIDDNS